MPRVRHHAAVKPLDISAPAPASDRKVYLFPFCSLVIVVAPALILINIKWLQKQLGELQGAEILAGGVAMLQFLQFILHHLRFRRSHWLLQWGAWAAYYVPMPLAALAVGMMLQLRRPFWPVAVLFAAGQSDTMAAYSLDDDSQNMRRFARRTLYLAYLIVALLQQWVDYYSLFSGFLVFLVHLKVSSMAMVSSGDICMAAAEAATRSAQQGELGPAVVALGPLQSRSSAIAGSTTYEDILAMEYSDRLQDVCLSSALFLQLLQRYHGPHQRVDTSTANSAFGKLLLAQRDDDSSGYARALKLVEVQLSLMYDHFFSAHGSPSSASYKLYLNHWVFKIGFLMHILSLVYYPKSNLNAPLPPQQGEEHHGGGAFAIGVVYLLVTLELCQLIHYLTSDRFLVSYMCDRARALSQEPRTGSSSTCKPVHMVVLNAILETRDTGRQSTFSLCQYSLVEDCSDGGCTSSLGQRLMTRLFGLFNQPEPATCSTVFSSYNKPIETSQNQPPTLKTSWNQHQPEPAEQSHQCARPLRGRPQTVALSMEQVKAWILEKVVIPPVEPASASSSVSEEPSSSHSRTSRKTDFPDQLSCRFSQDTETLTRTILRWHIATWVCSMRTVHDEVLPSSADYMAATKLSSYCAYLVAFRPELLPGHHAVATRIFDEAIREAELHLEGETKPYWRYIRFMLAWERRKLSPLGVLEPGARLARRLKDINIQHGSCYCWAIIADFWAQMLLHLALSGNATAHIEHLAKGGEFVTRLWALLSNAGIDRNTTLLIKGKKIDDRNKAQSKRASTTKIIKNL